MLRNFGDNKSHIIRIAFMMFIQTVNASGHYQRGLKWDCLYL